MVAILKRTALMGIGGAIGFWFGVIFYNAIVEGRLTLHLRGGWDFLVVVLSVCFALAGIGIVWASKNVRTVSNGTAMLVLLPIALVLALLWWVAGAIASVFSG